ncbi:MAG: YdbC family protein [Oscillospiraceae bacterium]|nr:YdbC family protein [Oscillospiraceae bacterium]MDD3832750.1 YdbC family protein [Oscillospiraceae bacterium]MDD4402998.1 YdbC family protein [Desulfitobacteriaceae bacterium]
MAELKYEVVKSLGTISQAPSGWSKEVNLVSWNDRDPKYDIRDWAPDHTKMGKGITLTGDEIILLRDLLNEIDL